MNVLLCDVKFHTALHESSAAVTLHGKTPGFVLRLPPQNNPHATLMQPLQCVLQHHVANLHVSTHVAIPDDNNQMQAFQCNLQPEIPQTHRTTHTHTQPHPKQLEATVTVRQKKHVRTSALATASRTSCSSSPPAAILHGKAQGFVLRHPPQNNPHATLMQPLQCVSQHHVANLHAVSTHMATPDDQRFQNTLKLRTHTQTHPKLLEATATLRQRKNVRTTPAAPAAHTSCHSSSAAVTLHGKTPGFVLQLPPQNKSHATFMQPLQCVLQHHVANLHVSTHVAIPDDNHHAAIPIRSATTDSSRDA